MGEVSGTAVLSMTAALGIIPVLLPCVQAAESAVGVLCAESKRVKKAGVETW